MKFPVLQIVCFALLSSCAQNTNQLKIASLSQGARIVRPIYPVAEKKAGRGGEVIVTMEIDRSGKVVGAQIASSTNPALNQSVLQAAKASSFPADPRRPKILKAKRPYRFNIATSRSC